MILRPTWLIQGERFLYATEEISYFDRKWWWLPSFCKDEVHCYTTILYTTTRYIWHLFSYVKWTVHWEESFNFSWLPYQKDYILILAKNLLPKLHTIYEFF